MTMILGKIINELAQMDRSIDPREYTDFVESLADDLDVAGEVVGIGAGRMGYSLRAFVMRLSHMGYNASFIGDTNVPRVTKNSIVIINSSSGETPSNVLYAKQALEAGAMIYAITTNENSTIAKLAHVHLPYGKDFNTYQIMKTVYEQFTYLLLDQIAADVVKINHLEKDFIIHNHSILE